MKKECLGHTKETPAARDLQMHNSLSTKLVLNLECVDTLK